MPIYRGTTPLKAYKGDMQPVNVYRGSTKVAGWHLASYSGTSPLTVDCDYNVPPDALVIDGKCVQTGTPSPDSPAPISTITGDMTITGADGTLSDGVTVALGSNFCASLPDGTHDSYDAVTGVLTKNVGSVMFDGSTDERWAFLKSSTDYIEFYLNGSLPINNGTAQLCNYFTGTTNSRVIYMNNVTYIRFPTSVAGYPTTAADFKTWLAANHVIVYQSLATPTTVQLTPHLPVVRTGIKTLSIGADVVPTLSATVKSMESAITSITQG